MYYSPNQRGIIKLKKKHLDRLPKVGDYVEVDDKINGIYAIYKTLTRPCAMAGSPAPVQKFEILVYHRPSEHNHFYYHIHQVGDKVNISLIYTDKFSTRGRIVRKLTQKEVILELL